MSRVAKNPVASPPGVELKIQGGTVAAKGPKGSLELRLHPSVGLRQDEDQVTVVPENEAARAISGTMRSLLHNLVTGVHQGFEKKLALVGVGYRAQMEGGILNMTLGYSHPIRYVPPDGVVVDTPTQTEIIVSGNDKQKVGQVAAVIRAFRPPEPYKGKGVRYADERIVLKEAKKV